MKALILSGGKGTRLRPLTYTSSKQLIPIANKPIIFYGIEQIVGSGIKDIGIIVGESGREIKKIVGNGKDLGVNISYIYQSRPLGIAHAIKTAHRFLGDDDFILYLGDNLLGDKLSSFISDFNENKLDAKILLTEVEHPELFGVVEFKGKKIKRLIEKPNKPPSNLALCGVYIFNKKIFPVIDRLKPSLRGEYEITDAIQTLLDEGKKVGHSMVSKWWKDTGKLEDLLAANRLVLKSIEKVCLSKTDRTVSLNGRIKIGKDCSIKNSSLKGPVIVGDNVTINNCFIAPYTSLGNNCHVSECEIENSIILENVKISALKTRINDSLIGKNAEIISNRKKPYTNSFMIGDNSKIIIGE